MLVTVRFRDIFETTELEVTKIRTEESRAKGCKHTTRQKKLD